MSAWFIKAAAKWLQLKMSSCGQQENLHGSVAIAAAYLIIRGTVYGSK
jgi:hypothetical protein